jgi:hypothetical protein
MVEGFGIGQDRARSVVLVPGLAAKVLSHWEGHPDLA